MKKIFLISSLFLCRILSADVTPSAPFVYVVGYREEEVNADYAIVNFSISESDPKASEARRRVEARSHQLMEGLAKLNVSADDIDAAAIEADVDRDYDRGKKDTVYYSVRRGFSIRLREIDHYPQLLELLFASEVDELKDPFYGSTKSEEVGKKLEDEAIADAKNKAEKLATSQGLRIAGVYAISPIVPDQITREFFRAGLEATGERSTVSLAAIDNYSKPKVLLIRTVHIVYLVEPVSKKS